MEKSIKTLQHALTLDLQQLYNGETQLRESISAVLHQIRSEPLKTILVQYCESSNHKRLTIDRMLSYLSSGPGTNVNEIIDKLMGELQNKVLCCSEDILDLLIIPVLQQICYYKISAYRSAMTIAMELEFEEVAELIQQIIEWERTTDRSLMELAYREFSKSGHAIRS